jgi:hypothetical protein
MAAVGAGGGDAIACGEASGDAIACGEVSGDAIVRGKVTRPNQQKRKKDRTSIDPGYRTRSVPASLYSLLR